MIIAVASGKGGTGKTTVSTSLAKSMGNCVLADLDVEEPNSYHFLKPKIEQKKDAYVWYPEIDRNKCTYCGICADKCAYNCLLVLKNQKSAQFFPELCHSCELCKYVCPENAIKDSKGKLGVIESGKFNENGDFYQGTLDIGVPMATPLIELTKDEIKNKDKTIIFDSPPGTSCSAVEAIKDADYCILVAEPTPFGESDLEMMIHVVKNLDKKSGIILNKAGNGYKGIDKLSKKYGIEIIYEIPFSVDIMKALSSGELLVDVKPEIKQDFNDLIKQIEKKVNGR